MVRISFSFLAYFVSTAVDAADLQHQVFLKPSSARTYYVEGRFPGGESSMFLLDTGSSYTVINQANLTHLQEFGNIKYLKNLNGRLADGSQRSVPLYRVSEMTLDGNCVVSDVEVAVFPNANRQILGLSILRKLSPFLFMAEPPSLKVSNCVVAESRGPAEVITPPADDLALIDPPTTGASFSKGTAAKSEPEVSNPIQGPDLPAKPPSSAE